MHRSGTSLITSWLESSGLVTHDGSVHGPSVGNPKGNFEDKEFVDIHVKELKSRYPESKGWQVFSPVKLTFSSERHQQVKYLIQKRTEKNLIWGWKDPRTVFFLEEWKKTIPDLKVLLLWRPCAEVVRSLVDRSAKAKFDVFRINKAESVKMWIAYNTLMLGYIRQHPRDTLLFNTRDVISNGHRSFMRINDFLSNKLSYSDFMNTFDAELFGSKSICEREYSDHLESVESIQRELGVLSEK